MKIKVIDNLPPEAVAMLQALLSRSAADIDVLLTKVLEKGYEAFMKKTYVGYGHKSIADCGSSTIYAGGVSMLAAKAIQDWPLYSGQETSSRFIDFSEQPICDPLGTPESKEIHDAWMNFYRAAQEPTKKEVLRRHKQKPDESDEAYAGTVKARVFDITRGFLPAGIQTQLSWHSNLRQFGDHLAVLRHHPCSEMRHIAEHMITAFSEQYPSSRLFTGAVSGAKAANADLEEWNRIVGSEYSYLPACGDGAIDYEWFLRPEIDSYKELLARRPPGAVLPNFLSGLGQFTWRFELDFGSFRDIQRNRNGVCRMPLLSTDLGFEEWYIQQLDEETRKKAEDLIEVQKWQIHDLECDKEIKQYYCALGYKVPCMVTYGLPGAVYVLEQRTAKTVHPTLRRVTHRMATQLKQTMPDMAFHCDMDPDDWTVRRGLQTIKERQ